jgi:hypothetical protein
VGERRLIRLCHDSLRRVNSGIAHDCANRARSEAAGYLGGRPDGARPRHAFRWSKLVVSEVCYRRSRNADKRVRRAEAPLSVGESGFLIVKMSVGRTDLALA